MQRVTSWASLIALLIMSAGLIAEPASAQSAAHSTNQSGTTSPAAAVAGSDSFGIYSITACRDTTTVTVSGWSEFATNRVQASVSYLNDKGVYQVLQQVTSSNFGSGNFWVPVVLDYHTQPVDEGTSLQVIVQWQRSTGGGFTNVGDPITTYVTAADKYCLDQCSVSVSTSDRAPTNGVITLRSHFGSWFRPEGWLHGAMSVSAGQTVQMTFADVACNAWARVWFYPTSGPDRTPRMLPSQYWPDEFGVPAAGGPAPYAASFARGLPATKPVEPGDPFVSR